MKKLSIFITAIALAAQFSRINLLGRGLLDGFYFVANARAFNQIDLAKLRRQCDCYDGDK